MQTFWNWIVTWVLWPIWWPLALVLFFVGFPATIYRDTKRLAFVRHCMWTPQLLLGFRTPRE